jgi:hypothetical protein
MLLNTCQGKNMRKSKLILPANTKYNDLVGKEVVTDDGYSGRITGYYPGINANFPTLVQVFHNGAEDTYTRVGPDEYIMLADDPVSKT